MDGYSQRLLRIVKYLHSKSPRTRLSLSRMKFLSVMLYVSIKIRGSRPSANTLLHDYFHNATKKQIDDLLVTPFNKERGYQNFLKWNIDLIGKDALDETNFNKILSNRYLLMKKPSIYFTDDLYQSFHQHLAPTKHLLTDGEDIQYSADQKRLRCPLSSAQVIPVYESQRDFPYIYRLDQQET